MSDVKYDWYELVAPGAPLEQGDFIDNLPILIPDIESFETKKVHNTNEKGKITDIPGIQKLVNVILLTQSCDLVDFRDDDSVMLCARYPGKETVMAQKNPGSWWGELRNGRVVGAHLVNNSKEINGGFDYQVIVLKEIYTYPYKILKEFVKRSPSRIRLLPPYREHLSQAFARQIMRVGLPVDLSCVSYPYTKEQTLPPGPIPASQLAKTK